MANEVTVDMILSKYNVRLKKELTIGWVKDIVLTDADGNDVDIRIHWDMDNGYVIVPNLEAELKVIPEMGMPEFEYVLDSITEEQKIDKEAAEWAMSQY